MAEETDKLAGARSQGQAQFDSIKEMVEALDGCEKAAREEGWTPYTDEFGVACWRNEDGSTFAGTAEQLCEADDIPAERDEEVERAIHEDALSVEVRSGWYTPGDRCDRMANKPAEYCILLCTGGPACRIVGQLSEHGEPETATMEVQDWGTPWTPIRPMVGPDDYNSEPVMLAYARCFYFGE